MENVYCNFYKNWRNLHLRNVTDNEWIEKKHLIIKKLLSIDQYNFTIWNRLIWYILKETTTLLLIIILAPISRYISLIVRIKYYRVSAAICSQILGEKNRCGCSIVAQQRDDRKKSSPFLHHTGGRDSCIIYRRLEPETGSR